MNRELCEFYRDRDYPDHWAFEYWCEDEYGGWIITYEPCEPQVAIPTIPGLLAFLVDKLGSAATDVIDEWASDLRRAVWQGRGMTQADRMLAEHGKAALEALDDN